jgi:hypothetical protein
MLPQAPDNAANGHLGRACRVNFSAFPEIGADYKAPPANHASNSIYLSDIFNNFYFSKKFMKYSG